MYKDSENNNVEKKGQEKDEKVIIRVKRKIDDTTIPSIYMKKSNKRICNGIFYKHIDTVAPEVDIDKKNFECVKLFLKHEQCNSSSTTVTINDVFSFVEKKRKFRSFKCYEKDLKDTINNLKRYKIVNQNIQYIDLDKEKKGIYKIIDVDLLHECEYDNIEASQNNELKKELVQEQTKEEDRHRNIEQEQEFEYDLYVIDDQKLQTNDYMDYLYNIKNNNIDPSEVIVLEDVYGNNSNEYDSKSFSSSSSSSDCDTLKEMSDYPDESSSSELMNNDSIDDGNDHDSMSSDCDDRSVRSARSVRSVRSDRSVRSVRSVRSDNLYEINLEIDSCANSLHSDNYQETYENDYHHENSMDMGSHENKMDSDYYHENLINQFSNYSDEDSLGVYLKNGGCDENMFDNKRSNYINNWGSYIKGKNITHSYNDNGAHNRCNNNGKQKSSPSKKREKKTHMHKEKMNSLIFEEKIKNELEKRLKKKNENMVNITLSDKLKILEQMEKEYYDK
ncbi:hypothetical protein, conserved [Plasmodium gonderi]|uniref:Uncharacterized protein n=1 Tax=Plasmodium gonderi TaxID=77519 RepID=A0A1Y1JPY8_PLAGO|nr:hypothetical protein, conserved [Plasmodium gonderi]GAW83558.1 hypothetical protein, conserved [Plasmodium gonderi]